MKKDKIVEVLNALKAIATNTGTWLKVLILIIVGFGGAILFSKTKVRVEDCTDCNNQRRELIDALIDIKKDLSAAVNTSYNGGGNGIIFAQTATRRQTQAQQFKQSQQIRKVMSRIDSILIKYRMDSINKVKAKT